MSVKIIADSACDLPGEIIRECGIEIVPLLVSKDGKEYWDKVTIKPEKMYGDMRMGTVYKTAQVPPYKFEEVFTGLAEKKETAICISFSSGLSATFNSALIAREAVREQYPDIDLEIIDTKAASVGYGLIVYKAAQMAKAGKSKAEILSMLDFYIQHMEHIFTVDNLEYLFRGGRVSRTSALVGEVLSIKPILDIPEDGKLRVIEKIRGRKKALKKMIELMHERGGGADLKNQVIGLNHGDDLEGVNLLKEMIEEEFGCKDFIINIIGCAIGAHSGPGTLSVFFLNQLPNQE